MEEKFWAKVPFLRIPILTRMNQQVFRRFPFSVNSSFKFVNFRNFNFRKNNFVIFDADAISSPIKWNTDLPWCLQQANRVWSKSVIIFEIWNFRTHNFQNALPKFHADEIYEGTRITTVFSLLFTLKTSHWNRGCFFSMIIFQDNFRILISKFEFQKFTFPFLHFSWKSCQQSHFSEFPFYREWTSRLFWSIIPF